MQLLRPIILLFLLNLFDAVLTLFWVRNGLAPEGNHLMARLLDMGDLPFLAVKLAVGAVTALVFWYSSNFRLARVGLVLTLTVYTGLMGVHFVTGLSVFGIISNNLFDNISVWTEAVFAFAF